MKTEADGLDPDPPESQRRTLDAIRYLERAVVDSGPMEGIALRYGVFYGPGTAMADLYPELIRKRKLPVVGDGAGVWSFVRIDDAAAATVAALEHGEPGVYNVVDDEPAPVSECSRTSQRFSTRRGRGTCRSGSRASPSARRACR